jgi:hypothetical protein
VVEWAVGALPFVAWSDLPLRITRQCFTAALTVIPLRVERSNAGLEDPVPKPWAGPWRRAAVTIRTGTGLQPDALPELHVSYRTLIGRWYTISVVRPAGIEPASRTWQARVQATEPRARRASVRERSGSGGLEDRSAADYTSLALGPTQLPFDHRARRSPCRDSNPEATHTKG